MSHEFIEIIIPDEAGRLLAVAPADTVLDLGVVPAGARFIEITTHPSGSAVLRFEKPGPVSMTVALMPPNDLNQAGSWQAERRFLVPLPASTGPKHGQ